MKILFLFFILSSLVSCSKSSSSSRREARISEAEIQTILDNQSFDCASLGGPCPEGIARIFMIDRFNPETSGVCSGFVVTPSRVVTNNHCVPNQDVCESTYLAIYNGSTYHKARCRSILRSEEDFEDPNDPRRRLDYTVMEISDPFPGEAFKLSPENALPGESISAWVVDHTGLDEFPTNLYTSRITEFSCEVMDQTERASLMLLQCPIISGNSGSPVLNIRGEVVGVVWGGTLGSIDSTLDLNLRRSLEEEALATEVNQFRDAALGVLRATENNTM